MARRHRPEEHENHERWLVSYADFITLLFAFFVVMYAISQVNEGKYRVLSDAIVSAFQNPANFNTKGVPLVQQTAGFQPIPIPSVARRQQHKMADIADQMRRVTEPLMKQGQVRVAQSSRGVMVDISANLLFQPGAAALEPVAVQTLGGVAEVLAGVNNQVQVEGYTDNIPISNTQYPSNWELSSARASSVARLFLDKGIAGERLAVVGYADNRAVQSNDTVEGRARNRRVTIMVLP